MHTDPGSAPPSTSHATRATSVVVLPEPAGATHSTGPAGRWLPRAGPGRAARGARRRTDGGRGSCPAEGDSRRLSATLPVRSRTAGAPHSVVVTLQPGPCAKSRLPVARLGGYHAPLDVDPHRRKRPARSPGEPGPAVEISVSASHHVPQAAVRRTRAPASPPWPTTDPRVPRSSRGDSVTSACPPSPVPAAAGRPRPGGLRPGRAGRRVDEHGSADRPTRTPSSSPPTACARTSSRGTPRRACMPTMALASCGTAARGRRRRPADPGAAEHRRRLVHASPPAPGRASTARPTTPSTSTAQPFAQPHRRVRPRRPPGRVDRPVRRARRAQGRPGRVGRRPQRHDQRPDHRLPTLPLRAAASRPTTSSPDATTPAFVASLRPPVRPPRGLRRPGAVRRRGARRRRPAGRTCPTSYSPAKEMRLRVLDFGVDKYGLNAYLYDSTNDGTVDYDRVLFSPTKDGADAVGDLRRGRVGRRQGQDRRAARSTARPPACWSRSRR